MGFQAFSVLVLGQVSSVYAVHMHPELCCIVLKIFKGLFTFCIIYWILFDRSRSKSQWSNPTSCLSYTFNMMSVDALEPEHQQCLLMLWSISRHGIDHQSQNVPSLAWEQLMGTQTAHRICILRAGSRLAPRQWETSLQSNVISHWWGASLKSAMHPMGRATWGEPCNAVNLGALTILFDDWHTLACP